MATNINISIILAVYNVSSDIFKQSISLLQNFLNTHDEELESGKLSLLTMRRQTHSYAHPLNSCGHR